MSTFTQTRQGEGISVEGCHPPGAVGLATPLLTTLCSLQKVHSFIPGQAVIPATQQAEAGPGHLGHRGSYRPAWAT